MTQNLYKAVLCLLPLALLCSLAHGQDIPAVTSAPRFQGFQLPTELGSLTYSLSFAERLRTGYYGKGGNIWATDFSGNAAYLSRSETRPLTVVYSGGYLYNSGGVQSQVYQNLSLSQNITSKLWSTTISDQVSYLPEAPSSGLSGIPGVGDVGVTPPAGGTTGQDILSNTGQRISNTANINVQRQLTGSTAVSGMGSYFIQKFLTATPDAIDLDDITVGGGLSHRIDALSSVQGNYDYSHFAYVGQNFSFSTQRITIGYTKQINRLLSINGSAGPQIVSSGGSSVAGSTVNLTVDAGFKYAGERYNFSGDYTRGVRGGSGVIQGTFINSVIVQGNRQLGEFMRLSGSGNYTRNTSVQNLSTQAFTFQTVVGNLEVERTIAQNFNAFVSYSLQYQNSATSVANTIAFTGTSQTFGFGITYSPRQVHLGHQ